MWGWGSAGHGTLLGAVAVAVAGGTGAPRQVGSYSRGIHKVCYVGLWSLQRGRPWAPHPLMVLGWGPGPCRGIPGPQSCPWSGSGWAAGYVASAAHGTIHLEGLTLPGDGPAGGGFGRAGGSFTVARAFRRGLHSSALVLTIRTFLSPRDPKSCHYAPANLTPH